MLVGVAGTNAGWDVGEWPGVSSAVAGVWDGYGPSDLSQPDLLAIQGGLLKKVFGTTDPNVLLLDSPVNHLTASTPPFMIADGELDA